MKKFYKNILWEKIIKANSSYLDRTKKKIEGKRSVFLYIVNPVASQL